MKKNVMCLTVCALLLALSFSAQAQQPAKIARLGYLGVGLLLRQHPDRREALLQGLRDLGYVEGKNLTIDYRWAEGKAELLPNLAAQLVSLKPDVIFAGAPQGTLAAKKATATIPIVFVGIGDPVGIGVVDSLARPGGNITGVANMNTDLSGKRLELLKESAPKITSVAVLWNSASQGNQQIVKRSRSCGSRAETQALSAGGSQRRRFRRGFPSCRKVPRRRAHAARGSTYRQSP